MNLFLKLIFNKEVKTYVAIISQGLQTGKHSKPYLLVSVYICKLSWENN